MLLEANPDGGVELAQISMHKSLGETPYPAIYLEHIAAQEFAKSLPTPPQTSRRRVSGDRRGRNAE